MADNIDVTPGTGKTVATKDIGGSQFQKILFSDPTTGDPLDPADPSPVYASGREYETVAASQTDQVLGAAGAAGDVLDGLLIVPATTSPGAVSIKDGNGSSVTVFTGGASSVSNLVPFFVPLGLACVNSTTPGWKVTTGANVSVIGCGSFT